MIHRFSALSRKDIVMKKVMVTGSFDPITTGHVDIIRRAVELFGDVTVVILANSEKPCGMFSPDERLTLCKAALSSLDGVSVIRYGGLTADIAHENGVDTFVRGARSATDFEYECTLAANMKHFDPAFETVILPSSPEYSSVSSTFARELIKYNCDLDGVVPDECIPLIKQMREARK